MADATPSVGADRAKRSGPDTMVRPANDETHLADDIALLSGGLPGCRVIDAAAMAAFEGIAVRLAASEHEFELLLVHADAGRSIPVGRFDAVDVVAVWRSFSLVSGLPLMLVRSNGTLEKPYPQLGRLQLGAIRIRRRHAFLVHRRPRFLTRRKTARLPDRPTVWRRRESSIVE